MKTTSLCSFWTTWIVLPSTLTAWVLICVLGSGACLSAKDAAGGSFQGRTFYVDEQEGSDRDDGQSPDRVWRSLDRVNAADLQPGDTVRFKCGGVWRGSLVPVSGTQDAPVTYSSYGTGPKPLLLGSRPRNRPQDWVQRGKNLWATVSMQYHLDEQLLDLSGSAWYHHQEAGASAELSHVEASDGEFLRIVSAGSGTASNHLQLWGPKLSVKKGECLVLRFRARSSQPFRFPGFEILQGDSPWTRYATSSPTREPLDDEWDSYQVVINVLKSSQNGRLHINLGGLLPAGAVLEIEPRSLHAATPNVPDPLDVDVGNIIFDGGARCGWKKWSLDALSKPYDYYYDGSSQRVYLYLNAAPPTRHQDIELALARHIVNQTGKHHVVYDGLALRYGAAHGFGGGNTHHLTIRNCDLSYIGGAHQLTRPDGTPVRYGNAIEFWGPAHDNRVDGCRIWEVYDAALTNQGRGPQSRQINITYCNNIVRNAEYSFEYWNNPETAVTKNIRFINNTCVGAGRGWAHEQRPDPNGSHLMFYTNTATTGDIEIKYNIFYDHTNWGCRYSSGWEVLPEMDYNVWFSESGIMAYWFREKIAGFDEYRQATGLDRHSLFADPQFVDAASGNYRPGPESPARTLRPGGGAVGAETLW